MIIRLSLIISFLNTFRRMSGSEDRRDTYVFAKRGQRFMDVREAFN